MFYIDQPPCGSAANKCCARTLHALPPPTPTP